jgi:hypothetical protein
VEEDMTATDHNKLLSILFFVKGGLLTLGALFVLIFYGLFGVIFGAAIMASGKKEGLLAGGIVGGVAVFFAVAIGVFIMIFAGLNLMAGWKLHKNRAGARIWTIVASCVALLNFPLGTALGVYGLWFMFDDVSKQLYPDGSTGAINQMPPPPHSWRQ